MKTTAAIILALFGVVASQGFGNGFGSEGGGYLGYAKDYNHYPNYKFEYGVKDHHTGDHKEAYEHRNGDHTKGGYSLDEADGTKRVVEYHSDGHNGLQAVVKRIGHAHHPAVYGKGYGYGGLEGGYSGQGSYGKGGISYQNQNQY